MEGDIPEETVLLRADLGAVLSGLPLFGGLDGEVLTEIAAAAEWLSLPGGSTLFAAGELSDALYVVLSGCLGAFSPDHGRDRRRFVGRVVAGDTVGEMGLISGRPRSAHVAALRDSELVRISADSFNRIFGRHPQAMMRIARLTVDRLEKSQSSVRGPRHGARTFTLLPQSLEVDVGGFASDFVKALSSFGSTELVWSVRAESHTSHWFHKIESANDFVVYVGDATPGRWSNLCVRQADALLLLARAEGVPGRWAALANSRDSSMAPQRAELVLLHDRHLVRGAAARWLADQSIPHHHITAPADVARLARMLTGRGVGLVLSGGGARGFAHIGIVKALREAGVPIDLVGGTSMGGILGAGVAQCWSVDELTQRFRRAFVEAKPLRDYTLPFVSLVSGRKVSRLLRNDFGDITIEDLPLTFFCVSSNLTTGHSEVHRRGEVWRWLRASVAIPGVLPPVVHKGEVLVDGGTMNNLPVDAMRELGRGPVIGCDVGADRAFTMDSDEVDVPLPWQLMSWFRTRRHRPNIFQILWRAGMVNSSAMTAAHREKTDLLLQPPLAQIDMLNWSGFERAIAAGYEYAVRRLEKLPADSPLQAIIQSADARP